MIERLLKLLKIKFAGELTLKDGTMIIVDGDLAVGASVKVQSPDGLIDLPDGDYELETGEVISVAGGKIADITDVVDTTETPDINGNPNVGEVSVEIDAAAGDPPVEDPAPVDNPAPVADPVAELVTKVSDLEQRLADLEAKLMMRDEIQTEMRSELDFIKNKTLTVELKKSKDLEVAPLSRMDIIKNLKNKQ